MDWKKLHMLPRDLYPAASILALVRGDPSVRVPDGMFRVTLTDLIGAACEVQAVLASAALTPVGGMPVLPPGIAARRLSGFLTATDAGTGDACSWDIQALASRNPVTGFPRLIGSAQVSVFQADDSMTLALPVVAPAISGLDVSLAGQQGRQFAVSGVFLWA